MSEVAPIKAEITLADLEKIDVRVGTILTIGDVAGSDKLVKLTVDFGDRRRTILAGMKHERENPAEIVGKQALFVVNLPPRKMVGQVSEGMLFDIGFADGDIDRAIGEFGVGAGGERDPEAGNGNGVLLIHFGYGFRIAWLRIGRAGQRHATG